MQLFLIVCALVVCALIAASMYVNHQMKDFNAAIERMGPIGDEKRNVWTALGKIMPAFARSWERMEEMEFARARTKRVRAVIEFAQMCAMILLNAMEKRFFLRLLDRKGSAEDNFSDWEAAIARFLKMICELVTGLFSAGVLKLCRELNPTFSQDRLWTLLTNTTWRARFC